MVPRDASVITPRIPPKGLKFQELGLETPMACGMMRALNGEVAEWSKAHAWKVCIRKRIEGSNPSLTAIL